MPPVDERILRCVPHRAPILRLEQLLAATADAATALGREPRGAGALPWALGAIEGLAQTAALALGAAGAANGPPGPADGAPPAGMLVAVKRFAIAATPPPDAAITYAVRLVRRVGPTTLVAGRATCDGALLAEGELTLWAAPAAAT